MAPPPAESANGQVAVADAEAVEKARKEAEEKARLEEEERMDEKLRNRPFGGWGSAGRMPTAEEIAEQKKELGELVDPSNPNRVVVNKRANRGMLKHQMWREQQIKAGKMDPVTGKMITKPLGPVGKAFVAMIKWSIVGILLSMAAGQFIAGDPVWGYRGKWVKLETYWRTPLRRFTPSELALYNGRNEDKPIYLSILGHVYDVSANRQTYGPGGSYHFFSGADGSRAYVTGCFKHHITHDLRGLDEDQIAAIEKWKKFFDDHPVYKHVGMLELPEIDPESPEPTWEC